MLLTTERSLFPLHVYFKLIKFSIKKIMCMGVLSAFMLVYDMYAWYPRHSEEDRTGGYSREPLCRYQSYYFLATKPSSPVVLNLFNAVTF